MWGDEIPHTAPIHSRSMPPIKWVTLKHLASQIPAFDVLRRALTVPLEKRMSEAQKHRFPNSWGDQELLDKLLDDEIIELTDSQSVDALGLVKTVYEKLSTPAVRRRVLTDTLWANAWSAPYKQPKFRSIPDMLTMASNHENALSIDLEKAFFQLQLVPSTRRLMGFKMFDKFYRMKRLPMGYTNSVLCLQSLLECLVELTMSALPAAMARHIEYDVYVDNVIFFGRPTALIHVNNAFRRTSSEIGVTIGETVGPTSAPTHRGIALDLRRATATVKPLLAKKLSHHCVYLYNQGFATIQEAQSIAGLMTYIDSIVNIDYVRQTSAVHAFLRSMLYCRAPCNRLTSRVLHEMKQLMNTEAPVPLCYKTPINKLVVSDASDVAGAYICLTATTCVLATHKWLPEELDLHINIKEGLAATGPHYSKQDCVLLLSDSQALLYAIQRRTSRNSHTTGLLRQMFSVVPARKWKLLWIASHLNPADGPTRGGQFIYPKFWDPIIWKCLRGVGLLKPK
jgi:hypothetical protein